MIKQSITNFFDNYQSNKITDIPTIEFRPARNIFHYLIPERIQYKDLRASLKSKFNETDYQSQSFFGTLKRYWNQFEFRASAKQRILIHTREFTALYALVVFGFYSRHVSGWKRSLFVLKETSKAALYTGGLYGMNELLYPFYYKFANDFKQKQMFTISNLMTALLFWPFVALVEWNLLVSLRKTLFICAYGQIRDFMTELQRFYKLNPDHEWSKIKSANNRIPHPAEDFTKKLRLNKNSRASKQRTTQEGEQIYRQVLARNKGQKIPSSNLYLIMPEIYRPPTKEESQEHERKAAIKTKEILDKKGITWITVTMPEDKKKQMEKQRQEKKQKKSWLPW